jgi:predicted NBD/HSP70 family sugar kinase
MKEKADSQLIKTINETRLLNLIREKGPISRNELSKLTRISKVTVSDIVNRLNLGGYILEIGKGESTKRGGKRPILLKLNANNGFVVGIQILRGSITIALANLETDIHSLEHLSYNIEAPISDVITQIFNSIDALLEKHSVNPEKLISIGIGMPGCIDYNRGVLKYAVTLKEWIDFPISSRFNEKYNVPIIIENDINTITLGELLHGAGRGHSNIACVLINGGIGVGIIIDSKLIRGETSNAGEIGFLEVGNHIADVSRLKNLYHNQKYFGEILSEVNLHTVLEMKLQLDPEMSGKDTAAYSLEELLALGDDGNKFIREVLDEYAYLLAIVYMNLNSLINPSQIILSGQIIENSIYLHNKIKQMIRQSMVNNPFEPSSVVVGELGSMAGVKGAISLALQTLFKLPKV